MLQYYCVIRGVFIILLALKSLIAKGGAADALPGTARRFSRWLNLFSAMPFLMQSPISVPSFLRCCIAALKLAKALQIEMILLVLDNSLLRILFVGATTCRN